MPVEDRAADTWESLIAIADLAGGPWPEHAWLAAKLLTAQAAENDVDTSTATRLLADLRTVFGDDRSLYTSTVLARIAALDTAPWADRELRPSDLATLLKKSYGVGPTDVRENGGPNRKGCRAADLHDPWSRYLPPLD